MDTKLIRLIVAGEHSIFRHGLRRLLESEPEFVIVREIADGAAAIPMVRELAPDILLLGLSHCRRSPVETLTLATECAATTKTIVLTDRIDRPEVLAAVQLGVRGVVLKDSSPEVLFKSIRAVTEGETGLVTIGSGLWFQAYERLRRLAGRRRRLASRAAKSRLFDPWSPVIPTGRLPRDPRSRKTR